MESSTDPIIATITVPLTFWRDHSWRTSEEYPVGNIIKEGKRTATVAFTQAEWDNFYSDADYYADCAQQGEWSRSEDPALWAIGQSAIRAMNAIRKHEEAGR